MTVFKPNSKNTGTLCTFSVTSSGKSQGIFAEILRQKSWSNETKTGTFETDKSQKINLKFTVAEAAAMSIICQKQKGEATFFHNTGEVTSSIKFYIYNRKDKDSGAETPAGIALSVTKGDKKASVPFTFAEAFALSRWFDFAFNRIFTADYTERKNLFKKLEETKVA
jgi:hypothetical protein